MMDRMLQIVTYWRMLWRAMEYHDWYSADLWEGAIERWLEC